MSIYMMFFVFNLDLDEVAPTFNNQLAVDVMLRRVHFTFFLKLLDIDILEAFLSNSLGSPCEFAHTGDILV